MRTRCALLVALLLINLGSHGAPAPVFNVRDYGAKGDKNANDRTAIQAAVDACHKSGGGTVYFPAGDYLSGEIRLRSHVTLHIDAGATLWASTKSHDYGSKTSGKLLTAREAEHVAVVGMGTIHGQGTADYGRRPGVREERPSFRTGIALFEGCRNVAVRDVTILYSDAWTLHFRRCDTVFVDGVTIRNNYFRTNSDGIDPNSCRNVHISNCHIVAGDDCIVLKATEAHPCENVVVTNCTLETIATALKLGTESRGDFRNVHFSNCTIRNTPVGIGFYMKDGATMERVTFSNMTIETGDPSLHRIYPIFMDIEKRNPDSRIGRIRDVSFRDIHIVSGSGILIQGMPESAIENLTIQNLTFRVEEADDYSDRRKTIGGRRTTKDERDTLYVRKPAYLTLAHVDGLTLDDIRVLIAERAFEKYERTAVSLHEVENGTIRGIARRPAGRGGKLPVVAMENCRRMLVTGNMALPGTPAFLGLSGEETADISIAGNDLRGAAKAVVRSEEVPATTINEAQK